MMASPAVLRVLFGDESDSRKMTLLSGIPETTEELYGIIQKDFQVQRPFRIQYMDTDLDAFINLDSMLELSSKATIKVVYLPPEDAFITLYPVETADAPDPVRPSTPNTSRPETPVSSLVSSCSDDTIILQSPHSSPEVRMSWPRVFVIPKFPYEAELELRQKNSEFATTGKYFTPGPKLKSSILDGLAQEMVKYTKYPQGYHCEEVAEALVRAHPCLEQLGTKKGFCGWKQSLKYKIQNYRTTLSQLGDLEIRVNSLKHKREGKGKAAAKIKKPRKAEVNYIPLYPQGENADTLETERVALLSEAKKSDNEGVIKAKMEKTFSHRRLEIVEQKPRIAEVKDRWPALFTPNGVNDEFVRITTKPLVSKFLSQLDHFSEKLISIFKPKGGAKGLKIRRLLEQSEEEDIDVKREGILKSLMVYLNEDPKSVFKDYGIDEVDNAENDVETTMMAIFVFRRAQHGFADDVWIIVEGVKVISRAGSVIMAFILLFGLIYALDLSYPGNLQHTFEFIQKVIMHMDGHRLNSKIQQLKMKMFQ